MLQPATRNEISLQFLGHSRVERIVYTRAEAATALGMSVDTFERNVQPFIKLVPWRALLLVPPEELRRWARENSRFLLRQTA